MNVHSRDLACTAQRAGELIDSLSSKQDLLWPVEHWPAMRFDRPLGVGAVGGHGPIRYRVEHYTPGREVRFRFTAPAGFDGYHALALESIEGDDRQRLRHTLEMNARGRANLTWTIVYRWLHDALVENALDRAEQVTTGQKIWTEWSWWVRALRRVMQMMRRAKGGTRRASA